MTDEKRAEEMSLEELLRKMPIGFRAAVQPDGSIVIDEPRRDPWPRAIAAAFARESIAARTARRVQRTAELTAEGRSAQEIGRIVAAEEKVEPFPATTVKGWRRKGRGGGANGSRNS